MISVRKLIASEKEAKILGVLATVLAVLQVAPILFSLLLYVFEGGAVNMAHIGAFTPSFGMVVIILWLLLKKKRSKKEIGKF